MSAFGGKGDPRRPFPECLLVTLTGTPALQSHFLEASSGETTLGGPRRRGVADIKCTPGRSTCARSRASRLV